MKKSRYSEEQIIGLLPPTSAACIDFGWARSTTGPGNIARMVAGLMALQANLPPLDFSALDGKGRRFYIGGIHAAMGGNYVLLTSMFERLIARTQRPFSSSTR